MKASGVFLRGMLMGAADIVPGVSGGTVAFITGIYDTLLGSIRAVDLEFLGKLFKLDIRGAWEHINGGFLLALLLGIATSIFSLARLISWVLHNHPVPLWAFFFGLILASALVLLRQVQQWNPGRVLSLLVGTSLALFIALSPVVSMEVGLAGIFLSGFLAICAMILPGISGAFILLILGKYEFITATLKNPFLPQNLMIIIVFCLGCLIGLLSFSRLLNFLLTNFRQLTMAFLTGLMVGSMPKIWPWKEILETKIVRGKSHIIWGANIIPEIISAEVLLALVLAVIGFIVVLIIERLSRVRESD